MFQLTETKVARPVSSLLHELARATSMMLYKVPVIRSRYCANSLMVEVQRKVQWKFQVEGKRLNRPKGL
jgi:hypothetical protein